MDESLVILGCHRSGTSTLSAVLNLCGYSLPSGDVDSSPAENPSGYFENRAVVHANNDIMGMMGLRWDGIEAIDLHVQEKHRQMARDSVWRVVEQYFSCGGYTLKDPRMSTLWPFWMNALNQACPVSLKVILAVRNPLQVSRSLVSRHQRAAKSCGISTIEDGLHFWIVQTLGSIRGALCFDFAVADSDAFSKSPLSAVHSLKEALGLTINGDQLENAVTRFEKEVRRDDLYRKASQDDDIMDSEVAQIARNIHARLLSAKNHSDLLCILKDYSETVVLKAN